MDLQPVTYPHLLIAFGTAFLFYLLIPGAGAFYVRSSWRRFRRALLRALQYPALDYQAVHGDASGYLGCFRFFGRLQALSGDETVWLTDGRISVPVHLGRRRVYILSPMPSPALENGRYRFPRESPQRITWSRVGPLPQYTQFFVAGGLYREHAGAFLTGSEECPLTVVIYEGEEQDVIPGAIWSGRQRNEYWNLYTPWSLALGSLLLFFHFSLIVRTPALHLPAAADAALALLPLIVFAPPGLLFYYLYRSLWRRGRELRAFRDLLHIPVTICASGQQQDGRAQSCTLPTGERYVLERFAGAPAEEEMGDDLWQLEVPELRVSGEEYYVFTAEREPGEPVSSPADPAARAVMIPGDPYELAGRCERRAVREELLGVFLFTAGALLNGLLLFLALTALLR